MVGQPCTARVNTMAGYIPERPLYPPDETPEEKAYQYHVEELWAMEEVLGGMEKRLETMLEDVELLQEEIAFQQEDIADHKARWGIW